MKWGAKLQRASLLTFILNTDAMELQSFQLHGPQSFTQPVPSSSPSYGLFLQTPPPCLTM